MKLKNYLSESINDRGILKCLFLSGLPGAGKTTLASRLYNGGIPMMSVNSDIWTEYYLAQGKDNWEKIEVPVKQLTTSQTINRLNGLLPIIVDTTGTDLGSTKRRINILHELGYELKMLFVEVDLQTSLERATKRHENGGRFVGAAYIEKAYKLSMSNKSALKSIISDFTVVKNNDGDINPQILGKLYNIITSFYDGPIKSEKAKFLIDYMKSMGYKYYNDIDDTWKIQNGYPLLENMNWFNVK